MPAVVLPNIGTAKFTATGGLTPRTLVERAGDTLCVKDYGVKGDNSTDDADKIQAVFDLAFGPASAPHGKANSHQNRPVYFPNGIYKTSKTLNLTRVVGGLIYGAGETATQIVYTGAIPGGATVTPLIKMNGMANTAIRTMNLSGGGTIGQNTCALDIDWDDAPGGDGLHDNEFYCLSFGADIGAIIARTTATGGANQQFVNPFGGGLTTALDIRGAGAWNTQVVHPSIGAQTTYKVAAGSLITQGGSGESTGQNFLISGATTQVTVVGGRSETATTTFKISGGLLQVIGFNQTVGGNFADISGGKVYIQTSNFNQSNPGAVSKIIGNGGQLYLRANLFQAGYRSTYTGTLVTNPAEE